MMVVIPPPVMMMSVMMMVMHAVSRRRLDSARQTDNGKEDSDKAGSECAFEHD
ncbi:hypothetical protein [Mesorhizobium sp.]|uniref:hypothetical protein n=1 Tax=Mesorhizobium sp. TaxID=1871066 RepID=UPI003BA92CB7